ncbi:MULTISPECIES: flagellar biosynthetic protein FliO [Cytobacillus]|uniref:Flagellar biosynthesis protein FliZ n=1 Tax=Cytobacillus oceanisediminis 2691 TaxID=1196031 RepID=A0A160MAB4_9BACI|nr:flagellar biosynthetic protein FliO [Cytobacillus oceanisediminis]MBY0157394.1 flagellar biosynthetic protein FliO [Cytobacillus firmus]AND39403.1 flagellar biosynthesis protein FliZ [Cytobacillus oceanisediminis 2691]MCM3242832.1 flagellar biosynthetic protein FliO [Cytobacillus oceanisediminis]MCM3394236.1 flagellar biosynthetic protein FliO [Cytobacillus oceanisediminis]MCM3527983.1 flagellar biosynthetic protein FliO [Cytobacillus oceanisediminis]
MVLNVKKVISLLLLFSIVLLGLQPLAQAEQLNNSVKECMENPKECEKQETKESKDLKTDEGQIQQDKSGKIGLTFWDFIKMILATGFTIGLLYALLKFINKKSKVYNRSQLVENLGGTALGANRSVQLIKVGNRIFVVGVGENIQLLKEIDDSEEYSQIIKEHNDKLEQLIRPSDIVTKVMKRTQQTEGSKQSSPNFSSLLGMQLDDIKKGRKKLFDELERKGQKKDE